jgi:hypothetical protein
VAHRDLLADLQHGGSRDGHQIVPVSTYAARGREITLVPTWRGVFGVDMAGEVMLPGDKARLGHITFDDWLADRAR